MRSRLTWWSTMRPERKDRLLLLALAGGTALILGSMVWWDITVVVGGHSAELPHELSTAPITSGALAATAAVGLLVVRATPRVTAVVAAVAVAVPLAVSVALWLSPRVWYLGITELWSVLLLLAIVAYRCRPRAVLGVAALVGATLLSEQLRDPLYLWSTDDLTLWMAMMFLGLAPGLYLRWHADRHRTHAERARREERLSVARDLHDVVAHQVTGIVVRVQALRHASNPDPDVVRAALPEIEDAATRALTSMRRLVTTLREPHAAPVDHHDMRAALSELEQPAALGRPRVEVELSGTAREIPADVEAAVSRIAQEAVTNALRHAREATYVHVHVELSTDQDTVRLEVRDDGRSGGSPFRTGAGYGLLGMAERARLLGGWLTAGPVDDGPGWRVRAELPLS